MPLIAIRDIDFGFGGPLLLEGINLLIEPGERVSQLGRNGCGKSTLLRLVLGEFEPSSGEITRQPNLRVAMLNQTVPQDVKGSVYEVVASGLGEAGKLLIEYHKSIRNKKEREP